METFERARLDAYFARISAQFAPEERVASLLITHLNRSGSDGGSIP